LNPIHDSAIASALVAAPIAKKHDCSSIPEAGEPGILKLMTLSIAGSGAAIVVLTGANTGLHMPKLAGTTLPTCDSGALAVA